MRRRRPDLILLDLRMPVMDGFDFRAQQLDDPHLADVPVVVVSASSEDSRIPALRAAAVMSKPANMETLLKLKLTRDLTSYSRHRKLDGADEAIGFKSPFDGPLRQALLK